MGGKTYDSRENSAIACLFSHGGCRKNRAPIYEIQVFGVVRLQTLEKGLKLGICGQRSQPGRHKGLDDVFFGEHARHCLAAHSFELADFGETAAPDRLIVQIVSVFIFAV